MKKKDEKKVKTNSSKETKVKSEKKKSEKKRERVVFFKGVISEMSKVVWPSRRNMIKYSIATIVFVLFFALYFYGIELLMAWLKSIIVIV